VGVIESLLNTQQDFLRRHNPKVYKKISEDKLADTFFNSKKMPLIMFSSTWMAS
jgi:hypothetical protein